MLQNSKLTRAMGFHDEETQRELKGTVAETTKQAGNAVPVNIVRCASEVHTGPDTPADIHNPHPVKD